MIDCDSPSLEPKQYPRSQTRLYCFGSGVQCRRKEVKIPPRRVGARQRIREVNQALGDMNEDQLAAMVEQATNLETTMANHSQTNTTVATTISNQTAAITNQDQSQCNYRSGFVQAEPAFGGSANGYHWTGTRYHCISRRSRHARQCRPLS